MFQTPKKKKKNHSTTVKIYSHHQIHPRQPPTPTSIHPKKNHKVPPTVVHSKIFYPYDISKPTPVPEKKKLLSPYPWLSSWPKSHQLEKKKKKRKTEKPKTQSSPSTNICFVHHRKQRSL